MRGPAIAFGVGILISDKKFGQLNRIQDVCFARRNRLRTKRVIQLQRNNSKENKPLDSMKLEKLKKKAYEDLRIMFGTGTDASRNMCMSTFLKEWKYEKKLSQVSNQRERIRNKNINNLCQYRLRKNKDIAIQVKFAIAGDEKAKFQLANENNKLIQLREIQGQVNAYGFIRNINQNIKIPKGVSEERETIPKNSSLLFLESQMNENLYDFCKNIQKTRLESITNNQQVQESHYHLKIASLFYSGSKALWEIHNSEHITHNDLKLGNIILRTTQSQPEDIKIQFGNFGLQEDQSERYKHRYNRNKSEYLVQDISIYTAQEICRMGNGYHTYRSDAFQFGNQMVRLQLAGYSDEPSVLKHILDDPDHAVFECEKKRMYDFDHLRIHGASSQTRDPKFKELDEAMLKKMCQTKVPRSLRNAILGIIRCDVDKRDDPAKLLGQSKHHLGKVIDEQIEIQSVSNTEEVPGYLYMLQEEARQREKCSGYSKFTKKIQKIKKYINLEKKFVQVLFWSFVIILVIILAFLIILGIAYGFGIVGQHSVWIENMWCCGLTFCYVPAICQLDKCCQLQVLNVHRFQQYVLEDDYVVDETEELQQLTGLETRDCFCCTLLCIRIEYQDISSPCQQFKSTKCYSLSQNGCSCSQQD